MRNYHGVSHDLSVEGWNRHHAWFISEMIYEYLSHRIILFDSLIVGVTHDSLIKKETSIFNSFMPSNSITIKQLNVQLWDMATKHKWDWLLYYTLYL